jgi:outer membrane protein assembly factor BamB
LIAVLGTGALVGLSGIASTGLSAAAPATPTTTSGCVSAWPQYQQDDHHDATGCSSLTTLNVPTLHPKWFASTPGAVTAEPTVADGLVYAGDATGLFHAINESTGKTQWTFNVNATHSCYVDVPNPHKDIHAAGFGSITASAAVANGVSANPAHPADPTVYVAGAGSLYALDAVNGACDWAQDIDPGDPTGAIEIESSPVVDTTVSPPEVFIGSDDNGSAHINVTGVQAFNASTGALLWRYEPERDVTLYPREFSGNDALTLSCGDGSANVLCSSANVPGLAPNDQAWADACGDVWSSPALSPSYIDPGGTNTYESQGPQSTVDPAWRPKVITATGFASADGLLVFGTGNCAARPSPSGAVAHGDYAHTEGDFALDPRTGVRVWNWFEPVNRYNTGSGTEDGGGDDDFGSSAIVVSVPDAQFPGGTGPCGPNFGSTDVVVQGSKSGFVYGLCEGSGREIWGVQAGQPGQLSPQIVGDVGGFIASPSVGVAKGRTTAFFDESIPLPFANNGVRLSGGSGSTSAVCPGYVVPPGASLPPLCLDPTLLANLGRLLVVQAIDVATGHVTWRTPAGPSYAATSYSNGVVFAPSTTTLSTIAYNADNGLPLWIFPLGSTPASGASIAGSSVFLGTGINEGKSVGSLSIPPGLNGIWCFTPSVLAP